MPSAIWTASARSTGNRRHRTKESGTSMRAFWQKWGKRAINADVDTQRINALDGIRALSVLLVLWFHFWQQTWLMPVYQTPFLSFLGIDSIDPGAIRWVGYLFVDMMVLLSGFCLFLPYARSMVLGTPTDSAATFYKKRAARILPSYALCILVLFGIALAQGSYGSTQEMWRDFLSHLTFTYPLRIDTLLYTKLNGALWTVAVEVWFYLIFPLLAWAFKRFHVLIYLLMVGFGLWFTNNVALLYDPISYTVNSFPTFLPVFANGMLAALVYVLYAKHVQKEWLKSLIGILAAVLSILCIVYIWNNFVQVCFHAADKQSWQLQYRYPMSLVFTVFVLSTVLAIRPYRFLFGNRCMRFLASISFNLYIWHQWIMVRLSRSLGFDGGAAVSAAGSKMQWLLTLEALCIALAVATVLTYAFERPIANAFRRSNIRKINKGVQL